MKFLKDFVPTRSTKDHSAKKYANRYLAACL